MTCVLGWFFAGDPTWGDLGSALANVRDEDLDRGERDSMEQRRSGVIRLITEGETVRSHWTDEVDGIETSREGGSIVLDADWWAKAERGVDAFLDGGSSSTVRSFAMDLTKVLLPRSISARFDELTAPNIDRPLRELGVHIPGGAGSDLWALPWELLWSQGAYWLADESRTMTRLVEPGVGAVDRGADRPDEYRILVVEGPRRVPGSDTLRESTTHGNLRLHLGRVEGVSVLDSLRGASLRSLSERLAPWTEQPIDLLVFDGHGDPEGIWLSPKDGDGPWRATPPSQLAEALGTSVREVLLVSCGAGRSLHWAGAGETLARAGIPTVACQSKLEQVPAEKLVTVLASGLRQGQSLIDAVGVARFELGKGALNVAAFSRLSIWQPRVGALGVTPLPAVDGRAADVEGSLLAGARSGVPATAGSYLTPPREPTADLTWVGHGREGSKLFEGRGDEVVALIARLSTDGDPTVICGPPGIGKSALARHVGRRLLADRGVDQVIWLDATSSATIEADLERLGPSLGPAGLGSLDSWLEVSGGRRLVIFDGASSWREIASYVPTSPRTSVLITARDATGWRMQGCWLFPPLGSLDTDATTDIVNRLIDVRDHEATAGLVEKLHGHPQTIVLACAFIDATGVSATALAARLDEQGVGMLDGTVVGLPRGGVGLATIVESAWEELGERARNVLGAIAAIDRDNLERSILEHQSALDLMQLGRVGELDTAILELRRFALVIAAQDVVATHPLIRQVVRVRPDLPVDPFAARVLVEPAGERSRIGLSWRGSARRTAPVYIVMDQSSEGAAEVTLRATEGIIDGLHASPYAASQMELTVLGAGSDFLHMYERLADPLDVESIGPVDRWSQVAGIDIAGALSQVNGCIQDDLARHRIDGHAMRRPVVFLLVASPLDEARLAAWWEQQRPTVEPDYVVVASVPGSTIRPLGPRWSVLEVGGLPDGPAPSEVVTRYFAQLITSTIRSRVSSADRAVVLPPFIPDASPPADLDLDEDFFL